ncbi:hypothetical protein K435DRAFT_788993 [Dendrothele bispora CBS 962.96]|uniref:Cryptic loci regulator 2 N-terminal domain-containing protein n=1 Tax=Dendrothele bispora (strain CBS 962.96) TaxID=1314807 RepID=A0A4V4HIJ3_DENBC|nr:hypothetical protein K435DRAFT_788993 [Dendrothele bispora CBS 962.96]
MSRTPPTPKTHPTPSTANTTVTFPVSDGSSSNWPTKTTRVLGNDGSFNYYHVVDKEDPVFVRWCTQISEALQKTFSTLSPIKREQDNVPKYNVKDLPEGYRLFRHMRGTEKKYRADNYLYGSKYCVKFRSRNEFVPHAIWLFNSRLSSTPSSSSTNPELDHSTCKCKYAVRSSQPQTHASSLSSSLSLSSTVVAITEIDNSSPRTPSKVRTDASTGDVGSMNRGEVSFPVQNWNINVPGASGEPAAGEPGMVTSGLSIVSTAPVGGQWRNSRKRQASSFPNGSVFTPFKRGRRSNDSLGWKSETLSTVGNPNGVMIEDRTRIGSVDNATPRLEGSTINSARELESGSSNATLQGLLFHEGELVFVSLRQPIKGPLGDGSDDIRFWPGMIRGITDNRYILQLLGLPNTRSLSSVPHSSVLPYLAFHVSKGLCQSLFSEDIWDSNVGQVSNEPEDYFTASFRQVARNYATGLWLALKFSHSWGFGRPNARPWCLTQDSSRTAMSSTIPIYYRPVAVTHCSAMTTFPYLWWGPERLATNDLLRLKPSRNTFHHLSIPSVSKVLPPSGPGKMMAAVLAGTGGGLRGVVMRAREFFVEELKSPGTGIWAVRVCGMLYELADIDWDPPADAPVWPQSPRGANSASANDPDGLEVMPAPPKGYKFRPILPPHFEAVVSMDIVAGKFYPGTLSHPLLYERLSNAVAAMDSQRSEYLLALECVVPGEKNAVFSGSSGDEEVGGNHDATRKNKEVSSLSPIWFWVEGKRGRGYI